MRTSQYWKRVKQVLPCIEEDVWDRNPSSPNVLRVGDKLRMYYGARLEQSVRVGFAEADVADPFTWKKMCDRSLLDPGEPGAIDLHWIGACPWVVPITDTHWHMYYIAWGGEYGPTGMKIWRTSMAESDDGGITWERTGRSLLELGRPGACDEHGTGSCSVRKVGDEYWMWYTGVSSPRADWNRISVALAISSDGGHTFTPHSAGALVNIPPIIGMPGSTCSRPFVEHTEEGFRMWFSCAKDGLYYRIHYAESPDGIHFKWWPEPVLDVSASGWDHTMVCYPSILHLEDRTLMYYAGDGYVGIGVAELATR